MSEHLEPSILGALVDGELSPDQLRAVNEHLAGCAECTAGALSASMLKQATAQAGQRYAPSPDFLKRLAREDRRRRNRLMVMPSRRVVVEWAVAAGLVLASVVYIGTRQITRHRMSASYAHSALVSEAVDQHIAALASAGPLDVLSSDKHTVKPWFQGKLPFSFNLPDDLPPDTVLDGANLTYVENRPTAQLLYRIHKHRVSVFVFSAEAAGRSPQFESNRSGFHVESVSAAGLDVVAVSDVNPAELSALTSVFQQAQ